MTTPLAPARRLDNKPGQPLLDVRDLAVSFKVEHGTVQAVRSVGFQLHRGETVAIVGESGSGKSVTARAVMGLLTDRATVAKASIIQFKGQDLLGLPERLRRKLRGDRISMIFQEPMSSLNPVYTIGDQIVEAIREHRRVSTAAAKREAIEWLEKVQLPEPAKRFSQYSHQLSGGQRQRVMIAMALVNKPDVLIADEPTTALDVTVQAQILELLRELQRQLGMAIILITHDLTIVRKFSDYVYVMQNGQVREHQATRQVFAKPQHAYTRMLLASEPSGHAKPLVEQAGRCILEARDLRVSFKIPVGGFFNRRSFEFVAVKDLSLLIRRHETVGLVGESGSGKTSFGQAVLRLLDTTQGEVLYDGQPIAHLNRQQMRPYRSRIQVVFQDPFSSLNPRMQIGQIIEEGLIVNGLGATREERKQRVREALVSAGMPPDVTTRFPHEFSGGQRQRVAIARAIALEPEFIVLDEPTSALDLSVQAQIIELLRRLQDERGLSYLFISHDLKVVRALCHRVIVMQSGCIVEQGPVEQVLHEPETEYTRTLVRAAFEVAA